MSVDRIKMYLYRANGEFEILPRDKWEPRHNYLNSKEPKAKYTHDKYEYMPSICVFRENEKITRICLQACPSKVLYGHNLQEITRQDFEPFLDKLVEKLAYAGILTNKEVLRNHYLSGLDVNKLCIYPGVASTPFQILWNTPTKGRFEKSVTFYPDSGSTTYNHLTHRKFKFYDKTAQSDDLEFAPEELIAFIRQASFTLLNMEYSMQGKDEIDAEFKTQRITVPNTLETVFNPIVAQTILHNRASAFLSQMFTIDISKRQECLDALKSYFKKEGITGSQAKSALVGAVMGIGTWGMEVYLNTLLEDSDKKTVREFIKKLNSIHLPCLPEESTLREVITNALTNMEPITLETLKTADKYIKRGLFPPQSGSNTRKIPTQPLLEWAGGLQ